MRRSWFVLCALASIAIVAAGCGGGSSNVTAPAATQINISVDPTPVYAGYQVHILVNAYNDHQALASMAIDFTGDGTWDDQRSFNSSTVSTTFDYSYLTAGTYTVRVDVTDADDVTATKSLSVVVSASPFVSVTYTMHGSSSLGGDCGVFGLPAECASCSELLTSAGVTKTLGSFGRGASVQVQQGFIQNQLTAGRLPYSCNFDLQLRANQVLLNEAQCSTDSATSPPQLRCYITVGGIVP